MHFRFPFSPWPPCMFVWCAVRACPCACSVQLEAGRPIDRPRYNYLFAHTVLRSTSTRVPRGTISRVSRLLALASSAYVAEAALSFPQCSRGIARVITTRTVRVCCCARNWWSYLCAAYVPCFVFVAICLTLS